MNCPNCGNHFGCACSGGSAAATASDGAAVCTKCIQSYEASLKLKLLSSPKTNINEGKV